MPEIKTEGGAAPVSKAPKKFAPKAPVKKEGAPKPKPAPQSSTISERKFGGGRAEGGRGRGRWGEGRGAGGRGRGEGGRGGGGGRGQWVMPVGNAFFSAASSSNTQESSTIESMLGSLLNVGPDDKGSINMEGEGSEGEFSSLILIFDPAFSFFNLFVRKHIQMMKH